MSAALAMPEPRETIQREASARAEPFQRLFDTTLRMGLALTEAGGSLADASSRLNDQTLAMQAVAAEAQQMVGANKAISEKLTGLGEKAHATGQRLAESTNIIAKGVSAARANIETLARSANDIDVQVMAAAAQVGDLRKASSGIQNIAREIQLLAVNAGVEAARHGVAGRGFAVIAEAVKKLADLTRAATDQTDRHLVKLAATMESLQSQGHANLTAARTADAETTAIAGEISGLLAARESVSIFVQDIDRNLPAVKANAAACGTIQSHLQTSVASIGSANAEIGEAVLRFNAITGRSEELSGILLQCSDDLPISGLSALCRSTATRISERFEAAIKSGEIAREQLFDERYRPIAESDPQQFLTEFVQFTDRALMDLQEQVLASDRRILFCAAVDRNGYLPTHNRKFSQPQSADPVWNALHARNRRIFDDRTGLASARNQTPVLFQTYRRDMGGGQFNVINELAAPIVVGGRHWGGFRIGFRL